MEMLRDENWVLSVGTFLPMVGVLLLLIVPKANDQLIKMVALLTSIATLAVGVFTLFKFNFDQAGSMQFVAENKWIPLIKSSYFIGVDGISLPMYVLSMVITLLVVIYSLNHIPSPGNPKAFFILMLVLQTGMAGTFIAQDLILFFVFFELVLLPMYFLIGVWGGENRQYASLKFFLYTMFGSALMLVAFLARLARPCRFLGRVSCNSLGLQPSRRSQCHGLPCVHGDSSAWHRACGCIPVVALPARCLWRTQSRVCWRCAWRRRSRAQRV